MNLSTTVYVSQEVMPSDYECLTELAIPPAAYASPSGSSYSLVFDIFIFILPHSSVLSWW